eukprot:TRINITY_DN15494_c0_g3_i1.p1 TRINITY_DN15494_c0_g3~~TRINITY_DN15494_c0_g3_i1.p1  ORF type:complete len:287 (+),score=43.13 TRINITY_DN15494_c0_g3_i1:103-963(+)
MSDQHNSQDSNGDINDVDMDVIIQEKKAYDQKGEQVLEELPEVGEGFAGETTQKGEYYSLKVSNAAGYLCHISLDALLPCDPQLVYDVFRNPDNSKIFRDIKEQQGRKVLFEDPEGLRIVEVKQLAELKILKFLNFTFTTLLRVTEDERDADEIKLSFEMVSSDIMSRFCGGWSLKKEYPAKDNSKVWARCKLQQDVSPKGVPPWLKHVPVLGGLLRGTSAGAIRRVMQDLLQVIKRVNEGEDLNNILDPIPQEAKVQSHILDDFGDDEDDNQPVAKNEQSQTGKI